MTLTLDFQSRCDMAFIEPMHRNKPNITYLLKVKFLISIFEEWEGRLNWKWNRCELDTMLDAQWACTWATVHGK